MAVTLEDIAQAAGVSRSTVSRALAGSSRINVATRTRIQQLAEDMGYLPNVVARGLTTQRTKNLGIVLLDIAEVFVSELASEINRVACSFGYGLVLAHCSDNPDNFKLDINMLLERRVDAIIVADRVVADLYPSLLKESPVPIVVINMREQEHPVSTDNISAARLGVAHLLDLGHKRIAYIGSSRGTSESQERQAGYEQALRDRGITPQPELVVMPPQWSACEAGYQGADQLLALSPRPTAAFCFNDITAIGAISKISAVRLNVPEDMSVMGFDNINLAPHIVPALTTLAQQKQQIAELATTTALDLIAGQVPAERDLLSCSLITRDSTVSARERI